jgi:hypothetical protein
MFVTASTILMPTTMATAPVVYASPSRATPPAASSTRPVSIRCANWGAEIHFFSPLTGRLTVRRIRHTGGIVQAPQTPTPQAFAACCKALSRVANGKPSAKAASRYKGFVTGELVLRCQRKQFKHRGCGIAQADRQMLQTPQQFDSLPGGNPFAPLQGQQHIDHFDIPPTRRHGMTGSQGVERRLRVVVRLLLQQP